MATRPGTTSRTQSGTKPPAPPITVGSGTLLHPMANISGSNPINIGAKAIVQARAILDSSGGPISMGDSTVVAEKAALRCRPLSDTPAGRRLTIGSGVSIETGAVVEADEVGDYTIIEVGAKVGQAAVIGSYCKICAGVTVQAGDQVEAGTVVWGNAWGERRSEAEGKGLRMGAGREGMVEAMAGGARAVWSGK